MRCGKMRCGDIWRCGGAKKKEKQLMEYEELIALGTHTDIINELSANPEAYFNKYNSEGHIDSMETDLGNMLLDSTGEDRFYKDNYIFAYKDGMWTERKQF